MPTYSCNKRVHTQKIQRIGGNTDKGPEESRATQINTRCHSKAETLRKIGQEMSQQWVFKAPAQESSLPPLNTSSFGNRAMKVTEEPFKKAPQKGPLGDWARWWETTQVVTQGCGQTSNDHQIMQFLGLQRIYLLQDGQVMISPHSHPYWRQGTHTQHRMLKGSLDYNKRAPPPPLHQQQTVHVQQILTMWHMQFQLCQQQSCNVVF